MIIVMIFVALRTSLSNAILSATNIFEQTAKAQKFAFQIKQKYSFSIFL